MKVTSTKGIWLLRLFVVVSLIVLAVLTFYVNNEQTLQDERERFRAEFASAANVLQQNLQTRLQVIALTMRIMASHPALQKDQVFNDLEGANQAFFDSVNDRSLPPEIAAEQYLNTMSYRAISYSPIVRGDEREAWENINNNSSFIPQATSDRGYWMRAGATRQIIPAPPGDDIYVPVQLLYPSEPNVVVYLWNVISEPKRAAAIRNAIATKQLAYTDFLSLVNDDSDKAATLVVYPIIGVDNEVNGLLVAAARFDIQIEQALPDFVASAIIVLKSNSGNTFVLTLRNAKVISQEEKEYEDTRFEDLAVTFQLENLATATVYPSDEFYDSIVKGNQRASISTALLVIIPIALFIAYDYLVNRRTQAQSKVISDLEKERASLQVNWQRERLIAFGDSANFDRSPKELEMNDLTVGEEIGSGNFSKVYRGLYNNSSTGPQHVAVKVTSDQARRSALQEACITCNLQHPNLVQLIGVITKYKRILLVFPFCKRGTLLKVLQSSEGEQALASKRDKLEPAIQICSALKYLHERHFVHRDVATRNVLVNSNYDFLLCDFGLSRQLRSDTYTCQISNENPLKWLAPEALQGHFSTASDIYSLGVCIWEIFSNGATPYGDQIAPSMVVTLIKNGNLLPRPNEMPIKVYELCLDCWKRNPQDRPSAEDVLTSLRRHHFEMKDRTADLDLEYLAVDVHDAAPQGSSRHSSGYWTALQETQQENQQPSGGYSVMDKKLFETGAPIRTFRDIPINVVAV